MGGRLLRSLLVVGGLLRSLLVVGGLLRGLLVVRRLLRGLLVVGGLLRSLLVGGGARWEPAWLCAACPGGGWKPGRVCWGVWCLGGAGCCCGAGWMNTRGRGW